MARAGGRPADSILAVEMSRVPDESCVRCDPARASAALSRVVVWEDDLWRLSTTLYGAIPGFSYLEPKRHIPHLTDLDGPEAQTFGPVLARVTTAIREATGAELIYVYVFGGGSPTSTRISVRIGRATNGTPRSSAGNSATRRCPMAPL